MTSVSSNVFLSTFCNPVLQFLTEVCPVLKWNLLSQVWAIVCGCCYVTLIWFWKQHSVNNINSMKQKLHLKVSIVNAFLTKDLVWTFSLNIKFTMQYLWWQWILNFWANKTCFIFSLNHSRLCSRLSLVSSNEGSVISRSVEIFVVSEVGLWTGASAYYSLSSLTRIYRCDCAMVTDITGLLSRVNIKYQACP